MCGRVWIPKEAEASFPKGSTRLPKGQGGSLAAPAVEGSETGTGQGGLGAGTTSPPEMPSAQTGIVNGPW